MTVAPSGRGVTGGRGVTCGPAADRVSAATAGPTTGPAGPTLSPALGPAAPVRPRRATHPAPPALPAPPAPTQPPIEPPIQPPGRPSPGQPTSGRPAPGQASPTQPTPGQHALGPYEAALRHGGRLYLRRSDGRRDSLDIARWKSAPDAADHTLLARCFGPTLDIGCGPGRLVSALVRRGVPALGIDVAPAAVRLTADAGAVALHRSVFDPLPGEGRWSTALLADGNIGIGGDPAALLARVSALLGARGHLIVETDPEDADRHERFAARVEDAHGRGGAPFRWARVGARALAGIAPACGLAAQESWTHAGRYFTALAKEPRSATCG